MLVLTFLTFHKLLFIKAKILIKLLVVIFEDLILTGLAV